MTKKLKVKHFIIQISDLVELSYINPSSEHLSIHERNIILLNHLTGVNNAYKVSYDRDAMNDVVHVTYWIPCVKKRKKQKLAFGLTADEMSKALFEIGKHMGVRMDEVQEFLNGE